MSRSMWGFRVAAGAIIALGLLLSRPHATRAASSSCYFCSNQCPGDMAQFCGGMGCGDGAGGCLWEDCQTTTGEWYTYTIWCINDM